jgi:hypothetical protein
MIKTDFVSGQIAIMLIILETLSIYCPEPDEGNSMTKKGCKL